MLIIRSQTNIGRPAIKNTLIMYVHNELLNNVGEVILPFYVNYSDMKPDRYDGSLNVDNQLS